MYASEMVEVRVDGNNILFKTGVSPEYVTIDRIQLSHGGVIKEFPDLEDQSNWKEQAIERFKDNVKCLKGEDSKMKYIIEDLRKHGYVVKYFQKGGHRVKRIE